MVISLTTQLIYFFKTLRIIEKFLSCISIRIRRGKLKWRKLRAKYVKNNLNLDNILRSDIGYMDFKYIRIYPDFLQQMKNIMFSLICQQGMSTFFVIFTSVEHQWAPLFNTLTRLHDKRRKKLLK